MENLDFIIILSIAYITLIGLMQPKRKVEAVSDSKIIVKRGRKRYVDPNQLTLDFTPSKKASLENQGIRELKKMASQAKIKRYSYLTKAQLIEQLMEVA